MAGTPKRDEKKKTDGEKMAYEVDFNLLDPPPPFEIKQLPKSTILGYGAFGVVYKATYEWQPVAVKTLKMVTSEQLIDLKKECDIMKQLLHPNICRLLAYDLTGDRPCIVMELAELGSLYQVLQDKKKYPDISWERKLSISLNIAIGVSIVHLRKHIHRDLKSLNILIRENWTAFIADFGLVKKIDASTESKQFEIGTYHWMAPEMWEEHATKTASVDIYSFGMILYEILTRNLPFGNCSRIEVGRKIDRKERPTIPPLGDCPPDYIKLMQDCWQNDPKNRPSWTIITERLRHMMKGPSPQPLVSSPSGVRSWFFGLFTPTIASSPPPHPKRKTQSSTLSAPPPTLDELLFQRNELRGLMDSLTLLPGEVSNVVVEYGSLGGDFDGLVTRHGKIDKDTKCEAIPSAVQFDSKPCKPLELPEKGFACGMSVDSQENIYVCDFHLNTIHAFTSHTGQLISNLRFPTYFDKPWTLDIYQDHLYIATTSNLFILNNKGELKNSWQIPEGHPSKHFRGLKIDSELQLIYLIIGGKHVIYRYDLDGESHRPFGTEMSGHEAGDFDTPNGLTIAYNTLCICDTNNHRIQILDKRLGTHFKSFGKRGGRNGEFNYPLCIFFHRTSDLLFVGDRDSIQSFSLSGKFYHKMSTKFEKICGLFITQEYLYVTEVGYNTRQVQVFRTKRQFRKKEKSQTLPKTLPKGDVVVKEKYF